MVGMVGCGGGFVVVTMVFALVESGLGALLGEALEKSGLFTMGDGASEVWRLRFGD